MRRSLRRAAKQVSDVLERYESDNRTQLSQINALDTSVPDEAADEAEHFAKQIIAKAKVFCQDLCGDMVVEYLGTNVAALLVVHLGSSSVFAIESSVTSASLVIAALAAQHAPEVACDVFSAFCEMASGYE